jgi:hypothetical protein
MSRNSQVTKTFFHVVLLRTFFGNSSSKHIYVLASEGINL